MDKIIGKLERYFGPWRVAVLDSEVDKLWETVADMKSVGYLRVMNAEGRHIFMRPVDESHYMMADDLTWDRVQRDHQVEGKWRKGRMCVTTSWDNYQVWIRCDRSLSHEEKRYWLMRMGSDPGADPNARWGRMPGFFNRKAKHCRGGCYPLAKLIWVDYRDVAIIPIMDGLLEQPLSHQPQGGDSAISVSYHSLSASVSREDFFDDNQSVMDFRYCLSLLRRGVSEGEVKRHLRDERQNWKKHGNVGKYLDRTLKKAKDVIRHEH